MKFSLDSVTNSESPDFQILDPILGPHGDERIVDRTIDDRHVRPSALTRTAAHAKADLVVAKHAVLTVAWTWFLRFSAARLLIWPG